MALWVKENGTELELNEEKATIEHAESLGWKRAGDVKQEKRKYTRKVADEGAEENDGE